MPIWEVGGYPVASEAVLLNSPMEEQDPNPLQFLELTTPIMPCLGRGRGGFNWDLFATAVNWSLIL